MPQLSAISVGGPSGKGFWYRIKGLDELRRKLERLSDMDLVEEMEEEVEAFLRRVLQASQAICPYDTGKLHDSGFVSVTTERGRLVALIGYDTEYAVYVHEDPDARHAPPTQYKFLEEPALRMMPQVVPVVGAAVKRRIRDVASH